MTASHAAKLVMLVVLSTAWAASVFVLGLWLALQGPPWRLPVSRPACISAGVSACAGGMLIFMAFVADRLVPAVGRRQMMWGVEMMVFLVFILSGLLPFFLI